MAEASVLFTNVRVLDGSGEFPFTGEVLVQGNRIRQVTRAGGARFSTGGSLSGGTSYSSESPNGRPTEPSVTPASAKSMFSFRAASSPPYSPALVVSGFT